MSLWRKHCGRVAWGDGEPDTLAGKNAKAYREWSLWLARGVECPDAWPKQTRQDLDFELGAKRLNKILWLELKRTRSVKLSPNVYIFNRSKK